MNRKNTILIAVLINAGLLAVLMVAALTTQDELPNTPIMADAQPLSLPNFDDQRLFNEIPLTVANEPPMAPIKIPLAAVEPEPVIHSLPALVAETPAPVVAAAVVAPAASFIEVKVKKGDNLEKIAKLHHTTVDQILKLNQLKNSFLKIGQVLKVPTDKSLPKVADRKNVDLGPEYYTMKVGDNPWAIAMKHHMKVEELLRLNGLNEERARKLKPGDRLRIR
jgi:LysM repeat protein